MLGTSLIRSYNAIGVRLFTSNARVLGNNKIDSQTLLRVADRFMEKGKIRTAEDIYKNTIEEYPNCKEAYQKLWDSWVSHRSLKVTQNELDEFITLYKHNIGTDDLTTTESQKNPKLRHK